MDLTEQQKESAARWEASCKVFATIPGADRLISASGRVPSFHDGEVEAIRLTKNGPSTISIAINWPTVLSRDKIIVTLTATQVLDVALEGFSPQNVLWELWVRAPEPRSDYDVLDGDVELELDPIWGIGGTVLLRGVEISWTTVAPPAEPDFGGVWVD